MEMLGTVRECLRPNVELFVRGRQLSQTDIEQGIYLQFCFVFVDRFNNKPFSAEARTSIGRHAMFTKVILLESNNITGENTWLNAMDHKSTSLATTVQRETIHDWKQMDRHHVT